MAPKKSKSTSRARRVTLSSLPMRASFLRTELENDRNKKHVQTNADNFPDTLSTCKPIWLTGKRLRSGTQRPSRTETRSTEDAYNSQPFHWSERSLNKHDLTVDSLLTSLNHVRNSNPAHRV